MGYCGIPFRNGVPIGLGSVVSFGAQQFDPSELFVGGTAGAWYDPSDLTTLFTTSAGTTPVAMPGQGSAVSVGLMLDKSQGLVLGPELVSGTWANGTSFPFDTFTASGTGFTGNKTAFGYSQAVLPTAISVTTGKIYLVIAVVAQATDDEITIRMQDNSGGGGVGLTTSATFSTVTSSTTVVRYLRATSTGTAYLQFTNYGTAVTLNVTSVSVRELPGNHAIAFNDTTARPELRARVNLLERSEEFGNAYWSRDGVTISANTTATSDPLGGNTADKITEESTSAAHVVYTTSAISASAIQYTLSVYVKAAERTFARLDFVTVGYTAGVTVILNLSTLATTITNYGATSGTTATVTTVGNGWYRLVVTLTATAASYFAQIGPAISGTPANYTGDGTSGIYIWGADLRPANIGANVPAYQRIADANTYDTSGFPLYLRFDGIDDSMYTPANLNLSGTDKVSVFAGVRKLSDLNTAFIAEFSAVWSSNNGAFAIGNGAGVVAGPNWFLASKGTAAFANNQITSSTATFASPITSVLTGTCNISGDNNTLRVNGANNGTPATGDQGAGNYGNFPLFIAARNNSGAFLNGHLHSLIIAGSAVSAGNISATEQWVAGKTGITI